MDEGANMEDLDLDEASATAYAGDIFTRQALAVFADLCQIMDKNQALGITITTLSETLGGMISLVKETEQEETIVSAGEVVKHGLAVQAEIIAALAYGQIGHA